jgi:hypothetical protein
MAESEQEALARVERAFYRVVWLLRDYLIDLVIIGGWVPYLYARFSGDPWAGHRSLTAELDVLIVPPLPAGDRPRLDETLRAAGLTPNRDRGPSAVWAAGLESGEMIEFLTPHTGTATQQGATVPVPGHGDVGAISLSAVGLLAAHTVTFSVPVGQVDGRVEHVDVRVPRLGAYVVNKAVTFIARRPHAEGPNPKQAKDLVYIHDVMAAGEAVRRRVEIDIRDIWLASTSNSADRQAVRTARNNLDLVLRGALGRVLLPAAASQLSTRDGGSTLDAGARIRGFLTDLAELLGEIIRLRQTRGRR